MTMPAKITIRMSQLNDHAFQEEAQFFQEWFGYNDEHLTSSYEISGSAIVACMKAFADRFRRRQGKELVVSEAAEIMKAERERWVRKVDEMIAERKRIIQHFEEKYRLTDETIDILEDLKRKMK